MNARSWLRCTLCLMVPLFLILNAFGQTRPTSTPPAAGTITRPGSIQDSGLYDYWADMSGQGRAGGALLGKVIVEGESLPWEPLLVNVTCDGKIAYSTQTDAKGNFAIVSVTLPGALGKQGDSQRQMETHFEGCLIEGSVPGFRSSTVTITRHMLVDQPDIGTITISRAAQAAATTVSRTTATVFSKALKSFEKAREDMLKRDTDGAQKDLRKAVEADPRFAEAWMQLGNLQLTSDPNAALDSYSKAMEADPLFVLPYQQLAFLSSQKGDWADVLAKTNHVLQILPDGTPEIWYLNALANYQTGKRDLAEAGALKSLALDPRHSVMNTEQLLAVILAQKGNYSGALEHRRSSLNYVPPGPGADLLKQQIAQLEKRASAAK